MAHKSGRLAFIYLFARPSRAARVARLLGEEKRRERVRSLRVRWGRMGWERGSSIPAPGLLFSLPPQHCRFPPSPVGPSRRGGGTGGAEKHRGSGSSPEGAHGGQRPPPLRLRLKVQPPESHGGGGGSSPVAPQCPIPPGCRAVPRGRRIAAEKGRPRRTSGNIVRAAPLRKFFTLHVSLIAGLGFLGKGGGGQEGGRPQARGGGGKGGHSCRERPGPRGWPHGASFWGWGPRGSLLQAGILREPPCPSRRGNAGTALQGAPDKQPPCTSASGLRSLWERARGCPDLPSSYPGPRGATRVSARPGNAS